MNAADGEGGPGRHAVELVRAAPHLVDVVAQLLWVAAPGREVLRGDADAAGLVPVLVDAPLAERELRAFRSGLDALLQEGWAQEAGTYLREVRDRAGRRLELAAPVAPQTWSGGAGVVGPFATADEAQRWSAEHVRPPLVGDVIADGPQVVVDVFDAEEPAGS